MKKNVRIIALVMAILTIIGTLFSLTSLAASEDVVKDNEQTAQTNNEIQYTPMNINVDLYVSNANLNSLTRIPDKFTISSSIADVTKYLKEIKRFNPEKQYLVLNVALDEKTSFGIEVTKPWMGLIKNGEKSSFYVFTPDAKLLDFASMFDVSKPSAISFMIYEKAEVDENLPFLKSI